MADQKMLEMMRQYRDGVAGEQNVGGMDEIIRSQGSGGESGGGGGILAKAGKVVDAVSSLPQKANEAGLALREKAIGGATNLMEAAGPAFDDWNEKSWTQKAGRWLYPRIAYGWQNAKEDDRRSQLAKAQKELNISQEEATDYVKHGIVPDKMARAEQIRQQREKEAIDEAGGYTGAIAKHIASDPVGFVGELAKAIVYDPALLLVGGVFKPVMQASLKAGMGAKAAATTGALTEANLAGAVGATGMALESYEANGSVDMGQVRMGAGLGFAVGGVIGAAQAVRSVTKRAANVVAAKTNLATEQAEAVIYKYALDNRVSYDVAVQRVLESHGLDASDFVSEIRAVSDKLKNELDEMPDTAALKARQGEAQTKAQVESQERLQPDLFEGDGTTPALGQTGINGHIQAGPRRAMTQEERIRKQNLAAGKADAEAEVNGIMDRGQLQEQIERMAEKEHMLLTPEPEKFAAQLERIAWKERQAAYGAWRKQSPAEEMMTTPAYKPEPGTFQKPIVTLNEFKETALAKSASGKPLSGAALQRRYEKFNRDMQHGARDAKQVVTADELAEIMSENSPGMKSFFANQARTNPRAKSRILDTDGGKLAAAKAAAKYKNLPARGKRGGSQSGHVDPRLLAIMGGSGFAALVGYSKRNDVGDALTYLLTVGGTLALGGKLLNRVAKLHPVTTHLVKDKKGVSIDGLLNKWQGEGAVYERKLLEHRNAMRVISGEKAGVRSVLGDKAAPLKLREAVTDALEDRTGKMYDALSDEGKELFKYAKKTLADMGEQAKKDGVLEELIDYFVPHMYMHKLKGPQAVAEAFYGGQTKRTAMDTMHRHERVIPTYQMAEQIADLTPRTKDIAEIITMYGKSLDQARRSKQLVDSLKNLKVFDTRHNSHLPVLMDGKKAPKEFVHVEHPKLTNLRAHPDIAPALKSVLGNADFSALTRGALATSFFIKRNNVGVSMFHGKALLMSAIMSGNIVNGLRHPVKTFKDVAAILKGDSPALRAMYGIGDKELTNAIDEGVRNGLMLNMVEDVGGDNFYKSLDSVTNVLDNSWSKNQSIALAPVKGAGKVASQFLKGYSKVNKVNDAVMWDRIYTGFKLKTYLQKMEVMAARYGDTMSREQMSALAAEFTNDAYGGINWHRIANQVENRFGSNLAYAITGKRGRAAMQVGLFAPDWTLSQIRVFGKALHNKNPIQQAMYLRYQFNGLMMFGVVMDGLNYAMTGHHIWDNKDIGTLELPDGRRWSMSKQYWEPAHWMKNPASTGLNKFGIIPKSVMEVGTGQQYMMYGHQAPPIEDIGHARYAAEKVLPIWGQNMMDQGIVSGAASMAGFPLYGKPTSGGAPKARASRSRSTGSRSSGGRTKY